MKSTVLQVLLLLVISFLGTTVGQAPEIVNDILPDIQRVGYTARLNCTVARLKDFKVQWAYDGEYQKYVISIDQEIKVLNSYQGGVPQYQVKKYVDPNDSDRLTFQLVMARIRPDFSGRYECKIIQPTIGVQHWTKKTGSLTILYAPIIKPGSTTFVRMMKRGATSSLYCDAHGEPAPNITWVRSDGHLLPNGKAISRGKSLIIKDATISNTGVYRCVADNQIRPPAEALAQVYVYQPPSARVLQDTVGQQAIGRFEAKLDCIVQGYPTPTVNWGKYDGEKFSIITFNDKYKPSKQVTDMQNLMNGEQWYTLRILNVQASDFRKFYCVAKNREGSVNVTVTLFSTYDCQGPLCFSLKASNEGNNHAELTRFSPLMIILTTMISTLLLSGCRPYTNQIND